MEQLLEAIGLFVLLTLLGLGFLSFVCHIIKGFED